MNLTLDCKPVSLILSDLSLVTSGLLLLTSGFISEQLSFPFAHLCLFIRGIRNPEEGTGYRKPKWLALLCVLGMRD